MVNPCPGVIARLVLNEVGARHAVPLLSTTTEILPLHKVKGKNDRKRVGWVE